MKLKVMKTLMSRHNSEVATSALNKKMSRHPFDVATINQGHRKSNMLQLERKRSRLIMSHQENSMSRHHHEVATYNSGLGFFLDFHLEHFWGFGPVSFSFTV